MIRFNKILNFFSDKKTFNYNFSLSENPSTENNNSFLPLNETNQNIYTSITKNKEYLMVKYNSLINSDIVIREFNLLANNQTFKAFIIYIDGLIDTDSINRSILTPLMLENQSNTSKKFTIEKTFKTKNNVTIKKKKKLNLTNFIYNSLIPENSVKQLNNFSEIISNINAGDCALFVNTLNTSFIVDVKKIKQRSIDRPTNELVIHGSQEGFVEVLRTNTSLLRRLINNENLVIENISVGTITKTKCAVCYIKGVANTTLIAEVKYRLNNIAVDYLLSSGQLQHLIEDNSKTSLPQTLPTERPDRACNFLLEGRIIVIINGSPYVLAMPATFIDFLASAEDPNLNYKFTNFLKFIRILALLITILLPGIYIAITNFHQELIPTELLFAIIASRQDVPFPLIFELLLMEISFELIRESGIRVPSPIGSTIGLVGGLILGEAAVTAGIASPISIIIVAITGISSFAIPDFSLGFHFRLSRFIYIFLGFTMGFLGIALGIFIHLALLVNLKSFGVSYLAPYVPVTKINHNGYMIPPFWKKEKRPDMLNSKREKIQPNISMKWKEGNL